jgi:hypothetical protein
MVFVLLMHISLRFLSERLALAWKHIKVTFSEKKLIEFYIWDSNFFYSGEFSDCRGFGYVNL